MLYHKIVWYSVYKLGNLFIMIVFWLKKYNIYKEWNSLSYWFNMSK